MEAFALDDTTIAAVQTAYRQNKLTAKELVLQYLDRIQRLDIAEPYLGAIVTVNHSALRDAEALDNYLKNRREFIGPLHGIPVLVKDQVETSGIRTTFGSKSCSEYIPEEDAVIVQKLKQAGAIILAKTSMCDFAAGWFSYSSITGVTKNPYDLEREAGGSSAGTAAGVAANLGLIGIGEDTGGSIRIPASFNNLFGLRVSTGLISRTGLSPLVHFQDTPGPIARTVQDLAKLLDTLVGFDPLDEFSSASLAVQDIGSYEKKLAAIPDNASMRNMRVGVLRSAFGTGPDCAEVNQVIEAAIVNLQEQGATVVDEVVIENLQDWIGETSLYTVQSQSDINRFLSERPDISANSFMDIYESQQFHPMNDLFHNIANGPAHPENSPTITNNAWPRTPFAALSSVPWVSFIWIYLSIRLYRSHPRCAPN